MNETPDDRVDAWSTEKVRLLFLAPKGTGEETIDLGVFENEEKAAEWFIEQVKKIQK